MMVWMSRIFYYENVTEIKIILINESFSAYKTNLQIKYQKFMRGLHVSSATFLKRGNFCDFLFIYLDGNPSK